MLLCCMTLVTAAHSQKTLKTDNIYSIPVGNEMGLVREYTNDEILTLLKHQVGKAFTKKT